MEEKLGKRPGTRNNRGARAQIARDTGLDPAIVSGMLNGTRDNVKSESIEMVHTKLGLDPTWFSDEWPEGEVRAYSEYLKTNIKRARATDARHETSALAAGADNDDADVYADLRDLQPTEHELRAWARHIKVYRYPQIAAVKRAFILGMRESSVQASIDKAVNKVAADYAKQNAVKNKP